MALKASEAMMNGEDTAPFAEKIASRKMWREKINELEEELNKAEV